MKTIHAKASATGAMRVSARGVGFLFVPYGSAPGTFPINVQPNGSPQAPLPLYEPRALYLSPTRGFTDLLIEDAPANSTWLVYVFEDISEGVGDTASGSGGGIVSTSYSAAYNTATGNEPATDTAGIDLAGAKGFRAIIEAPSGTTLNGGTGKLWLYDATVAAWVYNPNFDFDLNKAVRRIATSDFETFVGIGRAFVELDSYTNSGAAGAATVYLRAQR